MIERFRGVMAFRVLRRALIICGCWLVVPLALAQQNVQTLIVGVDHRAVTSLNGDWHYLIDQAPARALYLPSGEINDRSYALNERPHIVGEHNLEYDFATAPLIRVPGDWNTQVPQLFNYEGVLWYQRDFDAQPKPNTRTFLHIGAANYRSHVWVNQKRVCDHEGGYTPFDCEVTSVLHAGANFVVIAVDATRLPDGIPSVSFDWFNYGGLTRDVSLVTVPAAFIDDYDVHLAHDVSFSSHTRQITGYVHVLGARAGTLVTVDIQEAGAKTTAVTNADGTAMFSMNAAKLMLWAPESPKLYKVRLSAGDDTLIDDIGFRDIRVDGTRIRLNGNAVFLQGANLHAEAAVRGGRAYSDEDVRTLFGYLKELNANFVRLAHYPHDERMERAADRAGIMIWSEIPNWQRISFDKPEVYAKDLFMLREMIRRDRNKASVILWSVSNETPNNPARTRFLTDLANEARRLDPSRLVTSAIIGPRPHGTEMLNDDPLCDALDVIGQNEYIGWYDMTPEDADTVHWTLAQKPVLMSEFGAEAKYGNHGADDQRWTEEQQVNVFRHQFAMLNKIPQLRGIVPWILMDFRSNNRNIPKLQDGYNRKGLISERGERKQSFDLVRKTYAEHLVGKAD
jgi:beta-glucuronidase